MVSVGGSGDCCAWADCTISVDRNRPNIKVFMALPLPRYVWLTCEELEVAWPIIRATRIQEEFCAQHLGSSLRSRFYARKCEYPVRQTFPLNLNTRYRRVQFLEFILTERNRAATNVFDHVRHLRCAWDRHDPRL